MIPAFNHHGVLPAGRYPTQVGEVERRFVQMFPASPTRTDLYAGWRERRGLLFGVVVVHSEWLDGSFVTAKSDARDVDVVTYIEASHLAALPIPDRQRVLELTVGSRPQLEFGCHSFLVVMYPEPHAQHQQYLTERGYWDRWWSRHRTAPEKGYLDVRGAA